MELLEWNVAAASNNNAPPNGYPEGMAYSAVNNSARETMAVIRRWLGDNNGSLTSGGSASAYTLTPNGTYTAYAAGQTFRFKANHVNTGATTLNVSALGAKSVLTPGGAALAAGAIPANSIVSVTYDGTNFLLTGVLAVVSSTIDHDATTNFVANEHIDHTSVTLTAGNGLTGGGDISANRTFAVGAGAGISVAADAVAVDFAGQTEIDIASIAADDLLLLWDTSASAFKKVKVQGLGVRVQTAATQTLALDDANSLHFNASASTYTVTVPPNSTVAFPIGTEIAFFNSSTGKQTLAQGAGVTIVSLSSNKSVKASGGGAYLVKLATDTWGLVGDLEA